MIDLEKGEDRRDRNHERTHKSPQRPLNTSPEPRRHKSSIVTPQKWSGEAREERDSLNRGSPHV